MLLMHRVFRDTNWQSVTLIWLQLMGQSQICLQFSWHSRESIVGLNTAGHTVVLLPESDPPSWYFHFYVEWVLKWPQKTVCVWKNIWPRISANNGMQRMPAICQLQALGKVKVLHSRPGREKKEKTLVPASLLPGSFKGVPRSFFEQTCLSSHKHYCIYKIPIIINL